jgi:TonB family protein
MRKCVLVLLVLIVAATAFTQQPSPQPEAGQHIYKVGEDAVKPPRPKNNVEAEFSDEARTKRISGRCAVSLVVDEQGNPQNIQIIRCTDSVFIQSTLSAVGKYRFWPATTKDGKPVPDLISVEVSYTLFGERDPYLLANTQFHPLPGAHSPSPDGNGVYPLTEGVSPPKMTQFSDQGYLSAAFRIPGESPCDVLLTISEKGKPSDPQVIHCEKPILDKLASQSLLKSRFQPGSFNGNAVPVRVVVHLEFAGSAPAK